MTTGMIYDYVNNSFSGETVLQGTGEMIRASSVVSIKREVGWGWGCAGFMNLGPVAT